VLWASEQRTHQSGSPSPAGGTAQRHRHARELPWCKLEHMSDWPRTSTAGLHQSDQRLRLDDVNIEIGNREQKAYR